MKVRLLQLYKTEDPWLKTGINQYSGRIVKYLNYESFELIVPGIKNKSREKVMALEAEKIIQQIKSKDYLVLLDESGKTLSSEGFAIWLNKKFNSISGDLVFVVGGPFGFDDALKKRANEFISLSAMTFTHQMVRLIFTEQLYRAMTILKNEPYHHV